MTATLQPQTGPANSVTDQETGSRVYIHPVTGERFTSVTTVLHVVGKDGLPYWAAKTVQEYAQDVLPLMVKAARRKLCDTKGDDRCGLCRDCVGLELRRAPERQRDEAADRGTRLHKIAEHYVLHDGEVLPHGDDLTRFVAQLLAFFKQFRPEFDAAEMTVINRTHMIAGTLDSVIRLGWCPPKYRHLLGVPMVGDIKSGKGVYPEFALQLSAYRHAEAVLLPDGREVELPDMDDTGALLHFRPDNYWVRPVDVSRKTFDVFLHVLDFYRWLHDSEEALISRAMYKPSIPTPATAPAAEAQRADPFALINRASPANSAIPF
jgi:hypothetical protein